jgi:acyl carrier protein
MDNLADRLARCFSLVFPNLATQEIPGAAASQVTEWDSVAQVNLLSVIGEEFGIDIDFEEFEGATSFPLLLDRLREISARA